MRSLRTARLLAFGAGLALTGGARTATAQTVFVRGVGPGSTVELAVNSAPPARMTADAGGLAKFEIGPVGNPSASETSAHVFVDACPGVRRVLLAESGQQPPAPGAACDRKSVPDLFIIRPITTMVVELSGVSPEVWIRQGPAPPEWVGYEAAGVRKRVWIRAPTGFMVSGGVSAGRFSDAFSVACGDADQCAGHRFGRELTAAATYWFTPLFAAEVSYIRPPDVTASGGGTASSGAAYHFDSTLETRIVAITGKVGRQFGALRLYGIAGANHTEATSTTVETVSATATSQGGTETIALKTSGWSWIGGAGAEGWVRPWLAIYGEGGLASLKGSNSQGGEGSLDDQLTFVTIGVRVRIGR